MQCVYRIVFERGGGVKTELVRGFMRIFFGSINNSDVGIRVIFNERPRMIFIIIIIIIIIDDDDDENLCTAANEGTEV